MDILLLFLIFIFALVLDVIFERILKPKLKEKIEDMEEAKKLQDKKRNKV